MYEGCPVELKMTKSILADSEIDEKVFSCQTKEYVDNEDELRLLLENAKLPEISLDAEYECRIWAVSGIQVCSGRVLERYVDKRGNNLRFRIENGFYKNNLN